MRGRRGSDEVQEGGAPAMGPVPCYKEEETRGLSAAGQRRGPWPRPAQAAPRLPPRASRAVGNEPLRGRPVRCHASRQPERGHAAPRGCCGDNVSCQLHSATDTRARPRKQIKSEPARDSQRFPAFHPRMECPLYTAPWPLVGARAIGTGSGSASGRPRAAPAVPGTRARKLCPAESAEHPTLRSFKRRH